MNFLRKSCCLLRRDRIFNLNSCQFICNLSITRPTVCRPSKGHCRNSLGQLVWTKSWQRPRLQPRPRSRCMSNSVAGLGLGQVDPQNFEESERYSSINTRRRPRPSQEVEKEGHNEMNNRHLMDLKYQIDSGYLVDKDQITKAVDMVSQGKCSDHQAMLDLGLVLLRGCGHLMANELPNERLQLAHHIVSTWQQLGLTMTVKHYNELLRCYIENRHTTEVSQFLETMSVKPNKKTYQLLLRCAGDREQALDLIQRMKDERIPVSESVFNALVYLHARTGDFASAQSVFETMQSVQLSPSSHTFTNLLQGLAECGDLAQMQKTFQVATAAGVAPSPIQVLSVVRSLAATGHDTSIPAVLLWLPDLLDADAANTLRTMLSHFVQLGLGDAIAVLIRKLPYEEDNRPFGVFVLQDMVKANWPLERIVSMCDLLSDRNPLALRQATLAALQAANTDLSLALFEVMKEAGDPIRPHYYWPLLIAARFKGEQEVFKIVEHSRRLDVVMDRATLTSHVLNFVSLEVPTALLRRLQDLGFTITHVFSPLLHALISKGQLDDAHHLCGEHPIQLDCETLIPTLVTALMSGSNISSVVDLLKLFLQSCHQPDDWVGHFLLELFSRLRLPFDEKEMEIFIKALSDAGLRCSPLTVEAISRQISGHQASGERAWYVALKGLVDPEQTSMSIDSLDHYFRHPRNMTLEQLNCHLGELQVKKMNTRGVLRLLLLKNCQQGSLKGVIKAKEELEKGGYKLSIGMKAALFDFYLRTDEADKAVEIYNELAQENDFILDDHKVLKFATLLVTQNKIEEAVLVLDKASKRRDNHTRDSTSMACRHLLVSMSRKGQPNDIRFMLETLVELGYCTISNKMIGPIIRTYLLRDDLEGAVQEFKFCVNKYKMTPLRYELMCNLILKASDMTEMHDRKLSPDRAKELIEEFLACCMHVHLPKYVKMNFIIGLADVGDIKWLEQTVKEFDKEMDYRSIITQSERLVSKDKPHAIKNLIEVFGRNQNYRFNIGPLLMYLLQIHCRHGDTQGALDLWSSVQEMGWRTNDTFRTTLEGLLESHNVPFPGEGANATVVPA